MKILDMRVEGHMVIIDIVYPDGYEQRYSEPVSANRRNYVENARRINTYPELFTELWERIAELVDEAFGPMNIEDWPENHQIPGYRRVYDEFNNKLTRLEMKAKT